MGGGDVVVGGYTFILIVNRNNMYIIIVEIYLHLLNQFMKLFCKIHNCIVQNDYYGN